MPPPGQDTDSRILCGILYADVVGYSRLMAEDEKGAVACIAALERVFAAIVPRHDGKFQVQSGDSFLGTFPTALGAAKAALEIQRTLHDTPVMFLDRDVVRIRIGVHLGDVLTSSIGMSSNDINLAARIQDEAFFGGIDVSEDVYRQVRNKLRDERFEDLGLKEFHNIGEPRRVYRVVLPWAVEGKHKAAPSPAPPSVPTPPPPSRTSDDWPRRVLLISLATLSFTAALYVWRSTQSEPRSGASSDVVRPPTSSATLVHAGEVHEQWPLAIGVMEIVGRGEAPDWMCEITHQGLNALLSKFDKLKVVSKDMIDWKKEKTGKKSFDVAKELGVTKMINGDLVRSGVKVTLLMRIVDTETGQQIDTCEATGTEDKLVEIQNEVGMQLVQALKVPVTKAERDKVLAARTNVDLDVTKRFADAFGGEEDEPPPNPKGAPGAWWLAWPPEAHADSADEQGVKQLLERYRLALEAKNLDQLAAIYVSLSDSTRDALGRYFQSANDLKIQFSGITVLFEGDEALATFTRSDNFKDVQTGRDVNLEVRVSTVVAKAGGGWKIKALRKPS